MGQRPVANTIRPLNTPLCLQAPPISTPLTPAPDTAPYVAIIILQCHTCQQAVDGRRFIFSLSKLDHRAWCNRCHQQRLVRLWICPCGVPWPTCPIHSNEPDRLRAVPKGPTIEAVEVDHPTPAPPTRARHKKRLLGHGHDKTIGHWLDQPSTTKQPRTEPRQVQLPVLNSQRPAGPNPNLMGPKLKARFPHLCQPQHPSTSVTAATSLATSSAPPPHPPPA